MIDLRQGDCLELMKDIPDKSIIVTDPPFNIRYHYSTYKDNMKENEYYEWLAKIMGTMPCVIIHYPENLYKFAIKTSRSPERVVSWVYNSNTAKQHRDICFFGIKPDFSKCGQPYKNPTDKRIAKRIADGKMARLYDWWEVNQVKNVQKRDIGHPCVMPLSVMENILKILPEEYTIVDPFMGSGTTGVACVNTGRNFIGIELDENYFNIAKERISNAEITRNARGE